MKKYKLLTSLGITLIVALIMYYFMLPAFNFTSPEFWFYVGINLVLFILLYFVPTDTIMTRVKVVNPRKIEKFPLLLVGGFCVLIGVIFFVNLVLSPLFVSKAYSERIAIDETTDFTSDVKPVDFNSLPLLDKDSSAKLGDRVMGQMPELVSQFLVSDLYTQINYKNDIVRVTPLEYNGFFKYFANYKDGVKGYITVNSVNGEAKLVKLEEGMKYMPSSYFFKNLKRHLRLQYPTFNFGEESFEIDNEGNPYWIIPTIKYHGIGIRREVTGVVILNPIDGSSKYYASKDVPTWVDHVYPAELVIEQVDDWGRYKNGFFNSIFGQKNVVLTTSGYNYTVMNDDVYLYTGITSAAADESNIGFILTNLRTKETHFYAVPGAEEFSAMASAEGQVQQMKYKASFPLLINLNGKATYVISLKDNAGLVKMYAFVDVADYQKVVVTDSAKGIETAAKNYLGNEDINYDKDKIQTKEIQISGIVAAMMDGNSYYYITASDGLKYRVSIKVDALRIPFLQVGNTITVEYLKEEAVTEIIKLK